MKLGKVKFINTEKGFGFIKSEDNDLYFRISKLKGVKINKWDYVVFELQDSKSHKGKFEITTLEVLNNENAIHLIKYLNNIEILSVYKIFPSLIDQVAKEKVADFKEKIETEAQKTVIEFDLFAFSEAIDSSISTYARKKPGDDDSFRASIVSSFPETSDKYLKSLNPNYMQNTYSDWGFYCCYQMERDYNKLQREIDEKLLPEIQSELRAKFIHSYNPKNHFDTLVQQFNDIYFIEIQQAIIKGENISNDNISHLTIDSHIDFYETFTILVLFSIVSASTAYLSALLS
jgi:cold shock CspA family protein